MINILFNEEREDSCYSLPTLGNHWTYLKQGLGYKVLQSIMTTGVTLLIFSALDNAIFICLFIYLFFHVTVLTMKLTQSTRFIILVIRLSVRLNRISKKLSWKAMVLQFSERRTDSCYSVTTCGLYHPWTHVK